MRRIEEVKLECSLRSRWQGNYAALNCSSIYENFVSRCSMARRDRSSASNLGRRAVVFEEQEVVRLVRLAVEREGGQSAFAKRHGVDRVFINMILNGKRHVSDSEGKALGLRKLLVAEMNSFGKSRSSARSGST